MSRYGFPWITGKEVAGYTLLIMILKEVEQMVAYIIGLLPLCRDIRSTTLSTDNGTQTIVHTHLVIEIVETRSDIGSVLPRVVHLSNKNHIGIGLLHP